MQAKPGNSGIDVVILDKAIISPGAPDSESFRKLLFSGKSAITTGFLPELEDYYEHSVPVAPVTHDVISDPENSSRHDRTKVFLNACLNELKEKEVYTKITTNSRPERRGTFAATSKGGILSALEHAAHDLHRHGFADPDIFSQLFCHDIASWMIHNTNSLGPCQSHVGACATGLHNLIQAKHAIQDGLCDVAFVAGSEASLHPVYLASFINLKAYAKDGCYPFDKRHQGFVAGEGAAIIVLSSRKWAEENNLKPLAGITGTANGSDAFHPVSINPDGISIAETGLRAIQRSGLNPDQIDLIQTHGTSTVANDIAESNAMSLLTQGSDILSPWIHGLKGMSGHLMGAAGVIEIAACLDIFEEQKIPPTAGFSTPFTENPSMRLATSTTPHQIDHILKWSFGFGGHLSAVVLKREQA